MRMFGLVAACAAAMAAQGGELALEGGKSVELSVSGQGTMRLCVRARLNLAEGEGKFVPALKIAVDGKPLAAKPVNVGKAVCDPTAKDLRAHGINTVFLNGNCVGVGADGKPGLTQLEKAMKLFREYGFNEKIFIFYMGDPVFYALNLQIQSIREAIIARIRALKGVK